MLEWYDPVLRRVTRIVLSSGQPGAVQRMNLPMALAGFYLLSGGEMVAFEVPAVAGFGDLVHALGTRYEISGFPSSGSPWRLTIDIPPRPVLPSERDSAIADEVRSSNVRNVAERSAQSQERIRRARTTFPQIETLRVVRDGAIWIRPTPARGATLARWDVFSRSGARIGYAALPLRATIKDGTAGWVIAVELQEDDVPTLVRYDIRR